MEKLLTYRYLFQTKDMEPGHVGVKVVTDIASEHDALREALQKDENIISCFAEYVCEYDCSRVSESVAVKKLKLMDENLDGSVEVNSCEKSVG